MKLNEFIVENVLLSIQTNAGPGFSMNEPGLETDQVPVLVKQALRRHTIVTGKAQDGTFQTAGPAWSGDQSNTWDSALDNAIKTWKTSINIQVNNPNELNTALGELKQKDIRYLLKTELFPANAGRNAGLLKIGNDGISAGNQDGVQPWAGREVDFGHVIDTPVEQVTNTAQMITAIGFSGWYFILQELLNKRAANVSTGQTVDARQRELNRMMTFIPQKQNQPGSAWLNVTWDGNVVRRISNGLTATLANGTEMPFSPTTNMTFGSGAEEAQELYKFFKELASGLIAKFKQQDIENQEAQDAPAVVTQPTLDAATTTAWVTAMNEAFKNSVGAAIIPGGRGFGYDREKISDLMNQLNTAGDWDQVDQAYNIRFEDLSTQLADELSEEDYQAIVIRRLTMLRRINPKLLYASIVWGEDTDSMDVSIEDDTYTVVKQLNSAGFPVVKKGSSEVKDVLVVDDVLKAAIELSGGTVPNLNIEVNEEHVAMAGALVVTVINDRVPEMTPFYTMQTPFSESPAKSIGPRRLLGLTEGAAVLVANGSTEESVLQWIHGQVMDDRLWLIGDESQDIQGAGNLHFDSRYRDESDASSGFGDGGAFEDVENTDEEIDLINRLFSTNSRNAALAELGQISPNDELQRVYDRVYNGYEETHNKYLDEDITDTEELVKFIESDTNEIPDGFKSIIGSIGVAYAAPRLMGKVFKESMESGWFGWGTDEELLNALIAQIRNRQDYLQVNALYDGDLMDDIDAEDSSWKLNNRGPQIEALKRAIGESVEADEIGLKPIVTRALERMHGDPTVENIELFRRQITLKNFDNVDLDAVIFVLDTVNDIVASVPGASPDQQEEFLLVVENFLNTFKEETITRRSGRSGNIVTGEELINDWKINNSEEWFGNGS